MRDILEVLILWAWILVRLWAPLDLKPAAGLELAWTGGALAYLVYLTKRHRYDARTVGFRLDNFRPALLRILSALAAFAVAVLAFAYPVHLQPQRMNPLLHWAMYFFWAVLQQLLLQAYVTLPLKVHLKSPDLSALASAVIFASAHLPNPTLTLVTFVGGFVLTALYLRERNLFVLALGHSLIAVLMSAYLPHHWLPNMYVGRFYLVAPR